jgi:2-polyprenyl-3-methyl-5-hydroxy-6-metoxy-1,4-benzoquinol methylase
MTDYQKNKHTFQGSIAREVRDFYNHHPYPPPINNLDEYRRIWQDQNRRRADFHLFWPGNSYCANLSILVAGCGTSQAAKHALRYPGARVLGIDNSETSIQHTNKLKNKYNLENLQLNNLSIEHAEQLGEYFDKIICTGVLHHLPDPEIGLSALRNVLNPGGAMHIMVYAPYGRTGIYMLQEFCHVIGIQPNKTDIHDLAQTLQLLPDDHPLQHRLRDSLDFRSEAGLADALLHPQDRAYSVQQLFDFIQNCGLNFGRWQRQAPYLPQCSSIANSPFFSRIDQLSANQKYAAMELFRGTMVRHSFIAYREDMPDQTSSVRFDGSVWQNYIPIRLPTTIIVKQRLPMGAAAVIINQAHTFTDLYLPIDKIEQQWFEAIDGESSINDILQVHQLTGMQELDKAKDFFKRLWYYDQVVFDTSKVNN